MSDLLNLLLESQNSNNLNYNCNYTQESAYFINNIETVTQESKLYFAENTQESGFNNKLSGSKKRSNPRMDVITEDENEPSFCCTQDINVQSLNDSPSPDPITKINTLTQEIVEIIEESQKENYNYNNNGMRSSEMTFFKKENVSVSKNGNLQLRKNQIFGEFSLKMKEMKNNFFQICEQTKKNLVNSIEVKKMNFLSILDGLENTILMEGEATLRKEDQNMELDKRINFLFNEIFALLNDYNSVRKIN